MSNARSPLSPRAQRIYSASEAPTTMLTTHCHDRPSMPSSSQLISPSLHRLNQLDLSSQSSGERTPRTWCDPLLTYLSLLYQCCVMFLPVPYPGAISKTYFRDPPCNVRCCGIMKGLKAISKNNCFYLLLAFSVEQSCKLSILCYCFLIVLLGSKEETSEFVLSKPNHMRQAGRSFKKYQTTSQTFAIPIPQRLKYFNFSSEATKPYHHGEHNISSLGTVQKCCISSAPPKCALISDP